MSRFIRIALPAAALIWAGHGQIAWAAPAAASSTPAAPTRATCACGMDAATCPHCSPAANRTAAPAAAPTAPRPAAPAAGATCACGKPAGACPHCAARATAGATATPARPAARVCACGKPAGSCTGACANRAQSQRPDAALTGPAATTQPNSRVCACGKPMSEFNRIHGRPAAPDAAASACHNGAAGGQGDACHNGAAGGQGDACHNSAARGQGDACHNEGPRSNQARCNGDCGHHGAQGGHARPGMMRHNRMTLVRHGRFMAPPMGTDLRFVLGGAGSSPYHHLGLSARRALWAEGNFALGLENGLFVQLNPAAGFSSWVSPHLGLAPMAGADLGNFRLEASLMAGLGLMLRTGAGDMVMARGNWLAEPRLELRTKPGALPIGLGLAGGYLFSGQAAELSGPTVALRATFR